MKAVIMGIFSILFLTACPSQRPAYIAILRGNYESETEGLKVRPTNFYYNSKKDNATCDVVFKFTNNSEANIRLDLSGSILKTSAGSLQVKELWGLDLNRRSRPLMILSKSDTSVNLIFSGEKNIFTDTLQVLLVSGPVLYETFYFRKSNASDKRRRF